MTIYIDLTTIKEFTQDHLETYKRLNPEEAYPWLFGKDLPESLYVISIDLVDFEAVNWVDFGTGIHTQGVRAGGKNIKEKEISRDIANFGFKLTQPAICVLQKPTHEIIPLNGRTRRSIISKVYSHVKNFIGIIYGVKPEYINPDGSLTSQAESDISIFGCAANAYTDPAGELSKEDVVREVKIAMANNWIGPSLEEIRFRVDKLCGKGVFTDRTRCDLSYRIFNQYGSSNGQKILPWDSPNIKIWRRRNSLNDVNWDIPKKIGDHSYDGIVYSVVSSETLEKSLGVIARTAKDNPTKIIRVIIHTGILKGYDPEDNYLIKIDRFRKSWQNYFDDITFAFYNGKPALFDRVELYGALPAIESMHDLTKIVKFVTPDDDNLEGLLQAA